MERKKISGSHTTCFDDSIKYNNVTDLRDFVINISSVKSALLLDLII